MYRHRSADFSYGLATRGWTIPHSQLQELPLQSGHLQSVVSFENEGERTTRGGMPQHVWKSWREAEKQEMLHLTDFHRAKMFNRIVKYFEKNTSPCLEDYNA